MERFPGPEKPNAEMLYGELRQRLEYGGDRIEWWQGLFRDLQSVKPMLQDENLIGAIDAFLAQYADLAKWIRKDEKSMQEALKTAYGIIENVMEAISKE